MDTVAMTDAFTRLPEGFQLDQQPTARVDAQTLLPQGFQLDQGVTQTLKADPTGKQVGVPQAQDTQEISSIRRLTAGVNREFESIDQGVSPTTPFETNEDGSLRFPPVGEIVLTDSGNQIRLEDGSVVPITDEVAILTMDDGRKLAFPRTPENRAGRLERFGRLLLLGSAAGAPSRFAGRTAQNVTEIARRKGAAEFGVDLSRGQATQINKTQALEENARQGVLGPPAEKEAARFFGSDTTPGVQPTQVDQAVEGVTETLGAGQRTVPFPKDAAESAMEALRTETARLKTAAEEGFDVVREAGKSDDPLVFSNEFIATVRQRAAQALDDADLILDPKQHPAAAQAMNVLNDLSKVKLTAGIPFHALDKARRQLVKIKAASNNRGDGEFLRTIRKSYTDFLEDAANTALISGDPGIAARNREAIGFWRQFRQITDSAVGNESDKVIRSLVSEKFDATVDQTTNWLFGATKVGMTPQAVKTTKRLKELLGADSQAFLDLRQGAFLKAVSVPLGATRKGPQAMATSLNDFLNSDLAKTLYQPQEVAKMRRLVGVLRNLVPPKNVTNPSRSAFKGAELLKSTMANLAGIVGFGAGGLEGAILGRLGFAPVTDATNLFRIKSSIGQQKLSNLIDATRAGPLQKVAAPSSVALPTTTATQDRLPAN